MPTPFAFALCADDYALAPGVSRGIREALAAGRLTATSAMTTMEDWPREAPPLRRFDGSADIGLHLNLTLGAPLGAMPSLAPSGTLPSIGALVAACRRGAVPRDEVGAEIERQLDAFAHWYGRPPDHVDGHQHVQLLAPVRDALFAALSRRGWRPWLRDSGDAASRILRRRGPLVKAAGVALLARGFRTAARAAGFPTNDGFSGFSAFDEATPCDAAFGRFLVAPGAAHLVMSHPGHVDEALRRLDPVVASRPRELGYLTSRSFVDRLAASGAELARLSDILAKSRAFQG